MVARMPYYEYVYASFWTTKHYTQAHVNSLVSTYWAGTIIYSPVYSGTESKIQI